MDEQNRVVDFNPAAQQLIGATKKIIMGQYAGDVFTAWPDWEVCFHDACTSRTEIALDGTASRYLELSISPVLGRQGRYTGRLIVMRDITERKRADEALQISEVRYRRLFEAARDGILILDADTGLITEVNPYFIEMVGISR